MNKCTKTVSSVSPSTKEAVKWLIELKMELKALVKRRGTIERAR